MSPWVFRHGQRLNEHGQGFVEYLAVAGAIITIMLLFGAPGGPLHGATLALMNTLGAQVERAFTDPNSTADAFLP